MTPETSGAAPWIEAVETVTDGSALVTVIKRDGRRVGYYLARQSGDGSVFKNGSNGHPNGDSH